MASCRECGHLQTRHSGEDAAGPCEACDCKEYKPVSDAPEPPYAPTPRQIAEADIYEPLRDWAHSYNGYDRIATLEEMRDLLRPLEKEFRKSGKIPAWIGVDLLRGWAFRVARAHNHHRMTDTYSCCPVMYDLAMAVRHHTAATKKDFPPPIPPILLEPEQRD